MENNGKKEKKRRESVKESYRWRKIQNKKLVLAVYLTLRLLVILTMIAQYFNGHYESVAICLLTLVLFILPSAIERRLHIDLPDVLEIVILFFIFAAEILGEINEYYLIIPFWDTMLHTINGFLFAAIGFAIVNILNRDKNISMTLSPFYMALTAFCFSMTIGVLWEIFEWAMDSWFGLDMQKDVILNNFYSVTLDPGGHNIPYAVCDVSDTVVFFADGTQKSLALGGYLDIGLHDTMMDMFVNLIGAVIFSVIGYFYVKKDGQGWFAKHFIPKVLDGTEDES